MGGKSGGGGSDAVVQEQQKQAADARKKETERQARIDQGMTAIKNQFEGAPVMGSTSTPYDWSKFNPGATTTAMPTQDAAGNWIRAQPDMGLPAGFTAVQVDDPNWKAPAKAAATPAAAAGGISGIRRAGVPAPTGGGYIPGFGAGGTLNGMAGGGTNQGSGGGPAGAGAAGVSAGGGGAAAQGPGKVWAVRGPDGTLHYQGQGFNVDGTYDTGQKTGGFGDDFYNKYKQGILDYYTPQVADQFGDAKKELTFRLARAGTLRSSAANSENADLVKQNELNNAQVLNKADQGAADLRKRVQQERASTEAQLYATEDPSAAASQATAAVRNIGLSQPDLSPLGAIFNIATVGLNNAVKGYQSGSLSNKYAVPGVNPSGASRYVNG